MSSETRPLVVGADGQIGRALLAALPNARGMSRRSPLPAGLHYLDLGSDPAQWVLPALVSEAYLCAAVTSLAACQSDPVMSARINVSHTVELARRLVAGGAFVIFLSTNLVYDGARACRPATDEPCPRTEYGRQKAETERQLLALGESAAIVRLTKVIMPEAPLFGHWRADLEQGRSIRPFTDMVMAPLSLPFVAQALTLIGGQRRGGLFQISGERDVTYAEAAQHVARRLRASLELVQPLTSTEAGLTLEAVPAHTTLDDARIRRELGLTPPTVGAALDAGMGLSS